MSPISIIIPTKNEGKSLEGVLKSLQKTGHELIVVDGHSSDNTRAIANKYAHKVVLDNKKGKGDAIKTALPYSNGDIIVFIDADGSHNSAHIEDLIKPITQGKAHLVIASRMLGGSGEFFGNPLEYFRFLTNKATNILINVRFGTNITDSVNGFRAIKKDVLQEIVLIGNGFSIEQEMTIKVIRKGYTIHEVPSFEEKRKHGSSHLTIKTWPELVINLFRWLI